MACMNLEGKVTQWYQNTDMEEVDLTWNQFVGMISVRFVDIKGAKIIAEFNKLKQTGSYDDYMLKNLKNSRHACYCSIKANIKKNISWLVELVKTCKQP